MPCGVSRCGVGPAFPQPPCVRTWVAGYSSSEPVAPRTLFDLYFLRITAPVKAKRTKDSKVTAAISRNIEQLMAARAAQHGSPFVSPAAHHPSGGEFMFLLMPVVPPVLTIAIIGVIVSLPAVLLPPADRLRLVKPPKDAAQWATRGMKIGNKIDQVRDAKNIKQRAQRNNAIPPPPPASAANP